MSRLFREPYQVDDSNYRILEAINIEKISLQSEIRNSLRDDKEVFIGKKPSQRGYTVTSNTIISFDEDLVDFSLSRIGDGSRSDFYNILEIPYEDVPSFCIRSFMRDIEDPKMAKKIDNIVPSLFCDKYKIVSFNNILYLLTAFREERSSQNIAYQRLLEFRISKEQK